MDRPLDPGRPSRRAAILGLSLWIAGLVACGPALGQVAPSRQVTLFGIHATPGGGQVDAKLKAIAPQLKKLFPGHSFKLLRSESKRVTEGQSLKADLGEGWSARADLHSVLDGDGNLQLRFALDLDGQAEFATLVRTPPNQLFFCDKMLPDGSRLLIGLGGR